MKKAQEKIDELQKNLEQQAATTTGSKKETTTSEVRKQKEKLEGEMTRLNQELEASKAKIAEYETQKSKLESDLKKANESQVTNNKVS
jgi:predicted  nucleic acid-binding Zn-ribbon protein